MEFLKGNFKNQISEKYYTFYKNVYSKYFNLKIKPQNLKLIFKIDITKFKNEEYNIKKEIHQTVLKHFKQEIYINLFEKNIYRKIQNFQKNQNKFTNLIKNYSIKLQDNFVLINFKLKELNKKTENEIKTFNHFKTTTSNSYLNKEHHKKLLKNNILVNNSFFTEIRLKNFFPTFKTYSEEHPIIKILKFEKNMYYRNYRDFLNQNRYSYKDISILTKKVNNYQKNRMSTEKYKNLTQIETKHFHSHLTYDNWGNSYHLKISNQNYLPSVSDKKIFPKSLDKKIKQPTELKFKKEKLSENTYLVKKDRYEEIKKEIERIKTKILIEKSEEKVKKEKVENLTQDLLSKKEKNQIAEDIYEIVLKKWEKDLIRRGLLNG